MSSSFSIYMYKYVCKVCHLVARFGLKWIGKRNLSCVTLVTNQASISSLSTFLCLAQKTVEALRYQEGPQDGIEREERKVGVEGRKRKAAKKLSKALPSLSETSGGLVANAFLLFPPLRKCLRTNPT